MATKDTVLETMKQAGTPLNAGKIAELSGLDRKEVRQGYEGAQGRGRYRIARPLQMGTGTEVNICQVVTKTAFVASD